MVVLAHVCKPCSTGAVAASGSPRYPEADECIRTLEGHHNGVMSAAFSPDGDFFRAEWSAESGECFRTLEEHQNSAMSATFASLFFLLEGNGARSPVSASARWKSTKATPCQLRFRRFFLEGMERGVR